MKIPLSPPKFDELMQAVLAAPFADNKGTLFYSLISKNLGPLSKNGEYVHWDKVRHIQPPDEITAEQWWLMIKLARKSTYKQLPFTDQIGKYFVFGMLDIIWKSLHDIDRNAGNILQKPDSVLNVHVRDSHITQSLMEESITSSQLEGASTTRKVAKEMLLTKRKPKDMSEQMIFNNYEAMQFVRSMKTEKLTENIILELHSILTRNTLDDPAMAGKFRDSDDINVVDNRDNTILHFPPKSSELKDRIRKICDFANEKDFDDKFFMHPIIKAIILHFMLAFDHPFVDGNGRTARALFYWSMAHQDYWLMEFVSISKIIKNASSLYAKAFLHTETDDNDMTYFIIHQLEVILRSINSLHEYLKEENKEILKTEEFLHTNEALNSKLNYRQAVLIKHALKHPGAQYFINGHLQMHNITYETARTDLLGMVKLGLLAKKMMGRAFVFVAPTDIKNRIANFR
jgi:Fic family protein